MTNDERKMKDQAEAPPSSRVLGTAADKVRLRRADKVD